MNITNWKIRAAVWQGSERWDGRRPRWYVDVYYAARRLPGTSVVGRCATDRDYSTGVIQRDFTTRLEALDYATQTVRAIRLAGALTAGNVSAEQAATAWARMGRAGTSVNPDLLEAP